MVVFCIMEIVFTVIIFINYLWAGYLEMVSIVKVVRQQKFYFSIRQQAVSIVLGLGNI